MSYLSYVHKTFGEVVLRVNNWEVPALLRLMAITNSKDSDTFSRVTLKSI
jgi:hypothetical protein